MQRAQRGENFDNARLGHPFSLVSSARSAKAILTSLNWVTCFLCYLARGARRICFNFLSREARKLFFDLLLSGMRNKNKFRVDFGNAEDARIRKLAKKKWAHFLKAF